LRNKKTARSEDTVKLQVNSLDQLKSEQKKDIYNQRERRVEGGVGWKVWERGRERERERESVCEREKARAIGWGGGGRGRARWREGKRDETIQRVRR
jgi:hypothetical protein